MLFELVDSNQQHVVADIQCNENALTWRVVGCEHFLIVRTKFGQKVNVYDLINSIQNLPITYPFNGQEMQVREGVFVSLFTPQFMPQYTVPVKPASYSVYGVEYNQSERKVLIYSPFDEIAYFCNVPSIVALAYSYIEGEKIFWKKKEKNRYVINIPVIPGYESGLSYSFDNKLFYPITKEMMNKTIFIDSETEEKIYFTTNDVGGFIVNLERKNI